MRRALIMGTVVAALLLAGCGSDDEPSGSSSQAGGSADGELVVVAEDIKFPEDTYATNAGEVHVRYRNEGSIVHTLLVEDVDGFKLEVQSNGDVDEGSVQLEPGTYTLYCDVAGHRQAGMEAELEVS